VILNPSYKFIFNLGASQCPNRNGNEFYYRRGLEDNVARRKHEQVREEGKVGNLSVRWRMSTKDESENLLDHLTERINTHGWRVISNPTRQPDLDTDKLKTLIQTMQKRRQPSGKRKVEETEPPEAA
jgi:hypothetical protein